MAVSNSAIRAQIEATRAAQRPLPPGECPACGGLECFCRPRFFAGQLLTDEDLNRLEHYLVEKNKLHNRYLHGWGVVCGLEVVCNPCSDRLTVRTGYALSPCGEDIVVCRDAVVNVCELIQKCRPATQPPDCDPFHSAADGNCQDLVDTWVLAICYDEKPSRGITALRGSSGAAGCSRCNCGGSSTCGCSCHSPATGAKNANTCQPTQRNPPPQCEPTLTCEGYSFIAYKAPPANPVGEANQPNGEWARRYDKCRAALTRILSAIQADANNQQAYTWFQDFKAALLDFFRDYPISDCTYLEKLNRIVLIPPQDANAGAAWATSSFLPAVGQITAVAAEYWVHCFCSTLLPPCPEPVACNCVPLATVKVHRSDCRILEVCNWGPRRLVLTFPHLQYWLSPWASQETLSAAIAKLCCAPFQDKEFQIPTETPKQKLSFVANNQNPFATLLSQAWLNKGSAVDAQTLMLAALGFTDADNRVFASQFEFDNALSFLLLNQVIRPVLEGILPDEWTDLMEILARRKAKGSTESPVSEEETQIASLRNELRVLRKTLLEQAEAIKKLGETRAGSGLR